MIYEITKISKQTPLYILDSDYKIMLYSVGM